MNNIAITYMHMELKNAHTYLTQTMEDVTDEVAHFTPEGKANPIAGTYAHLVFSEDFFTQGIWKGEKPLFDTTWKNKTGISELQPTEWMEAYPKWLKTVKIDVTEVKPYAQAVFRSTEDYLASLTDEDLNKDIDMSMFGMGSRKIGDFLGGMVIGHVWSIMGEISVLKGIQDLKGYPF